MGKHLKRLSLLLFLIGCASETVAPVDAGGDAGPSDAGDAQADPCSAPVVDPEKVTAGTPTWQVGEVVVFAAHIGNPTTPSPFFDTVSKVVAPNHVFDPNKNNIFKSAVAHPPPYDTELTTGLAQTTAKNSGCFNLTDFDASKGIIILVNLIPSKSASKGKSFEQPGGGPVISGSIITDGDLFIDGGIVDTAFDGVYPAASDAYGDGTIAGWGHLIVAIGDNQAFSGGRLTAGNYQYRLKIGLDGGDQTLDTIHFVVK